MLCFLFFSDTSLALSRLWTCFYHPLQHSSVYSYLTAQDVQASSPSNYTAALITLIFMGQISSWKISEELIKICADDGRGLPDPDSCGFRCTAKTCGGFRYKKLVRSVVWLLHVKRRKMRNRNLRCFGRVPKLISLFG